MISLAWGNVLAVLLPGIVALFALSHVNEPIAALLRDPNKLQSAGAASLLAIAALCGGVIEAWQRVIFDAMVPWLRRVCHPKPPPKTRVNLYDYVTPENFGLFQAAVDNSYKYYSFYANLAWAFTGLIAARMIHHRGPMWPFDAAYAGSVIVLAVAAKVQLRMFYDRIDGFKAVEKMRRGKK